MNVAENCLDRHVEAGHGDQVAYHWEGEPGDTRTITYAALRDEVARFANVLKSLGVTRGDRVAVYLPMIPELPVTMLACARIGAVHSVVFGGFSADALADRINDSDCKVLVTADGGWRRGKAALLKPAADVAVANTTTVEHVVVVQRTGASGDDTEIAMTPGRDHWYHELMSEASADCPCEEMAAEDLLYLLYTSGTTAKPKGVMHTTGGYLTQVAFTHRYVFDVRPGDVYWCAADVGWVTGHSYIVYGPLANRATSVMYEGTPDTPGRDRFWDIVERYGVNVLYTAPTAIRTFMKWGTDQPAGHDLSSLRVLGSVGEPINPEAWIWYHTHIGGGRCPIVDTWWQTETGGIMVSPIPGVTTTKPGSATFPLPGIAIEVVDEAGNRVERGGGYLTITEPWPSMLRGVWGDPRALLRHLLASLRGSVLRRRRRQDRRGRLPLGDRPCRRRDERVGPPHLDRRGRIRAGGRFPRRRGRGGRCHRCDDRPVDHRVRDSQRGHRVVREPRRGTPNPRRRQDREDLASPHRDLHRRPAQDAVRKDHASTVAGRGRGT